MTAIPLLWEDEHLTVVDKPAGLLSVPDLGAALARQGVSAEPVHRLDRDVSGCLVVARDRATRKQLEELFRERSVAKTYWALVQGEPRRDEGEIKYPILHEQRHARVSARGQPALTRFRVLRRLACHAGRVFEVEVDLVTGRYNQIRLHFAHDGTALVGERKYARGADDPLRARRVALHAWRVAFDHPRSGERIEVEAPLPADLQALLNRCRPFQGP